MLHLVALALVSAQGHDLTALPVLARAGFQKAELDWLVDDVDARAAVYRDADARELILDNGLVRRTIRLAPNAATVGFDNLMTGAAILRAVEPEARVVLDGVAYDVGGLIGQPDRAYLDPAWIDALQVDPAAWSYIGFEVGAPVERLAWKRVRHCAPDVAWPPKGVALRLDFAPPAAHAEGLAGVRVSVHYELYDGVPCYAKWLSVTNGSAKPVMLDDFTLDLLAAVEDGSRVETRGVPETPPHLRVESEYAMGGFTLANSQKNGVRWLADPAFETQINYERTTPCLLDVGPENLVMRTLAPGETFETYRAFVAPYDSRDATRVALTDCGILKTIAPWVTENPLMMHVRYADEASVHTAIDQCAEVGFELVILTFGSGFDAEDGSPENLARMKGYADYGRARGIDVGTYSLLSSRRVHPDGDNCLNPLTGEPGGEGMIHGGTPSLASGWGQRYLATLQRFFDATGAMVLEHDGPYPGNLDAAARPPLQHGVEDSRYVNWMLSAELYRGLRARGVYVNAPDWYYLSGTSKCGMGYRETNWSLPRAQQVIHTRQNIFDGTRYKLPTMGWMFVPLTQYHGGGEAATVEPLDAHLDHYEAMLASNLGAGVQACYRGPRLYDTPRVRDAVKGWVDWFHAHRDILESPIVHDASRRADGRDLDWVLHANPMLGKPALDEKGMLVVYNPTDRAIERDLLVDLYYTGLRGDCTAEGPDGTRTSVTLKRQRKAHVPVRVPAHGVTWLAFH